MNVKLGDPTIGIPIPNLNNNDVSECLNQYYTNFAPNTQSQHDFMYNYMLPTFQTILSQIKDNLVSSIQNTTIQNDITIMQPLNTIPITFSGNVPWNWNYYYKYLCLTGLENSNPFKSEIADITAGNYNIINPIEFSLYNQYTVNADNDIDKNCVN